MTQKKRSFNKLTSIPLQHVVIDDLFWSNRQEINRKVAIHHQYEQLEKANHINNFRIAAKLKKGRHKGAFYYDSDVYKWLEGACYILHHKKDEELKTKVDEIVNLILKSQLKDGYINTFYSTNFIEKRFSNITFMHELYCAGHLIEAAIAHYNATGSRSLLDCVERLIDLIFAIFMEEKKINPPGHQEIELALLSLYQITNKRKYFLLAEDFINRRGKDANSKRYIFNQFLNLNSTLRHVKELLLKEGESSEIEDFYANLSIKERIKFYYAILNGTCYQLDTPVRKIKDPVGHAVRAMYMFSAMTDLYAENGDEHLLNVLVRSWSKIIEGKMYITGGIGSIKGIEGFEKDFKLRINRAYSETCAAVGYLMWNWRMLQITAQAKYSDLIEKILYNSLLVGQSLDGKKYSYTNPLISTGDYERKEWFLCPCCPPNLARTIASLGKYIYSQSENGLYIHQYIGSRLKCEISDVPIEIYQQSQFPWQGEVKITLLLEKNFDFSIFLRIPEWSKGSEILINGDKVAINPSTSNYLEVQRNWNDKDVIAIAFEMQSQLIYGDPRVKDIKNKIAISNGPLIYCLEQNDNNEFDIFVTSINENSHLRIKHKEDFLDGINIIEGKMSSGKRFVAIPYYAWNNRGPDKMQIWHKKA
ncbi:MAG: glycoside hydrolase family 127 protein [Promethearchaeota archaeon]|nr:MAG: glycoside hydrolase family 127 protein [Candidatus Lokiarchaeota archaeon]